ncbi:post-transcriptional regulator [Alteribacillus bidgolensis]|uniref:Post-transcriptional regulator n=1 Tax=Alteribacillus bidgolensis TaxID=930129 RepID=A0A1G8N7H1_9BACI|nr:post-transcriptional regulator [Alteribacillus bidgolensis]SDI76134.1 Post-transcriptional regulator [Alteribacillus bidgolensis]
MCEQQFEVWKSDAEPALRSKVEEFQLMGYNHADKDEVWKCVIEKLKKKKDYVRFHVLINSILTLRLSEYMNRLTISAYKESRTSNLNNLMNEIENHNSNKRHLT